MAKTYLPQFVKMAYRMSTYLSKHKATMIAGTTDVALQTAINNCVSCIEAIAAYIDQAREKP